MKSKNLLIITMIFFTFLGIKTTQAKIMINFEDLSDLEVVTTQYSVLGVTFSNATALTAGISLNEFEFPPCSGSNVVFDDSGPMSLTFSIPIIDFGAYFTYAVPLALYFYDSLNNLKAMVTSTFSSNMALSGDPGSSPNELIQFAWGAGISKVDITGDPFGTSFTMDDLSVTPVPIPGTLLLLINGFLGILGVRLRKLRGWI